MANCPNIDCSHKILWDWDNDCFVSEGIKESSDDFEHTDFTCSCGEKIGTVWADGSVTDKIKEEIDWADEEHSINNNPSISSTINPVS